MVKQIEAIQVFDTVPHGIDVPNIRRNTGNINNCHWLLRNLRCNPENVKHPKFENLIAYLRYKIKQYSKGNTQCERVYDKYPYTLKINKRATKRIF